MVSFSLFGRNASLSHSLIVVQPEELPYTIVFLRWCSNDWILLFLLALTRSNICWKTDSREERADAGTFILESETEEWMGIAGRVQWALTVGSSSQARPSKDRLPGELWLFPFLRPRLCSTWSYTASIDMLSWNNSSDFQSSYYDSLGTPSYPWSSSFGNLSASSLNSYTARSTLWSTTLFFSQWMGYSFSSCSKSSWMRTIRLASKEE